MTTLRSSKEQFVQLLSTTLDAMVAAVESHNYSDSALTASSLAENHSSSSMSRQTLQLAMSSIVENCDSHHLAKGRNGGFKPGPNPEPIPAAPKKLSEKAALKAQIEDLRRQLSEQNQLEISE